MIVTLREDTYMYEGYEYNLRLGLTTDLHVHGVLYHRLNNGDFYCSTQFWLAGAQFEQEDLEAAQPLIDEEIAFAEKNLLAEIKKREVCL